MAAVLTSRSFSAISSVYDLSGRPCIFDKVGAARVKPVAKPRLIPPAPVMELLDWVLLDRRVVVRDHEEGEHLATAECLPLGYSATTVDEEDGVEVEIQSDLALFPAPTCSIAFLVRDTAYVREARDEGAEFWPTVVAADADRILMQIQRFPAPKLYVYTADPEHATLDALTGCMHPQRSRMGRDAAILARRDEYGIATLQLRQDGYGLPKRARAVIGVFRSTTRNWVVHQTLDVPEVDWFDRPDSAVPYMDRVCWVFHRRNKMLMSDIFNEAPALFQMRLPPSADPPQAAENMWRNRTVAVAENCLKFIDISPAAAQYTHISIWSLDLQGYVWNLQGRVEVTNSPLGAPIFPVPCAVDGDLLYVLTPTSHRSYHQLCAINWRTGMTTSSFMYAEDSRGILREQETAYVGSHIPKFVSHALPISEDQHGNGQGVYQLSIMDIGHEIAEGSHKVKSCKNE